MTPKQADKLIREGKPVTVHNAHFDETFVAVFVSRTRRTITSQDGGIFDRSELEIMGENRLAGVELFVVGKRTYQLDRIAVVELQRAKRTDIADKVI